MNRIGGYTASDTEPRFEDDRGLHTTLQLWELADPALGLLWHMANPEPSSPDID